MQINTFYGGPFSNWYEHTIYVHGQKYTCNEQFIMHEKAELFGDYKTAARILREHNPVAIKRLGRQVTNFDQDKWHIVCRDIMYVCNYLKFKDPSLQVSLLETMNQIIVEASPTDVIWGVGSIYPDPATWRGTNWLGKTLMKVRSQYTNEPICPICEGHPCCCDVVNPAYISFLRTCETCTKKHLCTSQSDFGCLQWEQPQ
jgi:hypothetical protein